MTTFICFECMESRRSTIFANPHCPLCQKSMIRLGYKIRIPKKDRKLWNEFGKWLKEMNPYYKELLKEVP